MSFLWLFFRMTTVNFELRFDEELDGGVDIENHGEPIGSRRVPKDPELDAISIPLILQEFDELAWKSMGDGSTHLLQYITDRKEMLASTTPGGSGQEIISPGNAINET